MFSDIDDDMRIAREEIFGPVLTVLFYTDEDEAIAIAENSEYLARGDGEVSPVCSSGTAVHGDVQGSVVVEGGTPPGVLDLPRPRSVAAYPG